MSKFNYTPQELTEKNAILNTVDFETRRFLIACDQGNLSEIKQMISPNCQLSTQLKIYKDLGFFFACRSAHRDVISYLFSFMDLQTIIIRIENLAGNNRDIRDYIAKIYIDKFNHKSK
jgi:hypothetical protein